MKQNFLFLILFLVSAQGLAKVDLDTTLFGIEYSFQDAEIVKEPGRTTMTTPYKREKLLIMLSKYVKILGLPQSAIQEKTTWKPGFFINVPNDGKYVINTEPVTIEFNTTPKKLHEIDAAAGPIYEAAAEARLLPYVNPAAERSGMGHIHVGGKILGDSPFYQNEHLLRNVLAFYHKHPSLLFGFSEAFDLGHNSNIETLHAPDRQNALAEIISAYDEAAQKNMGQKGLLQFIDLLKNSNHPINWTSGGGFHGFFAHYRFINLEHLQSLSLDTDPTIEGKHTVEFRMFRPPPTAAHAKALAKLLVSVMNHLSEPGHLEKFEKISIANFKNFMTGTKIESDWENVKNILGIEDPLLDSMVHELTDNVQRKPIFIDKNKGMEIFDSYSEKEFKGTRFEVRMDAAIWIEKPSLDFGGKLVAFEKVTLGEKTYWITQIDAREAKIDALAFRKSPLTFIKKGVGGHRCSGLYIN